MVSRLLAGERARALARDMGCSPTTVTTSRDRWLAASDQERASGVGCAPRRSVPRSCPWALTAEAAQAILDARAMTNWGPMRLTWLCGRHRSTIWKVLRRHGCSQRRRSGSRQTSRRYEWAEAGALLHIDAFSAPKFDHPGHWATGDRSQANRSREVGKTVVIGVEDDHSRLAYCELHSAEKRDQRLGDPQARLRVDARAGLRPGPGRHVRRRQVLLTVQPLPPDTRRARGAAHPDPALHAALERQDRAILRDPGHRVGTRSQGPNSTRRNRALSSFLRPYNRQRPHSAADGRPPITRVHQVSRTPRRSSACSGGGGRGGPLRGCG
jgi:hypothetical protein